MKSALGLVLTLAVIRSASAQRTEERSNASAAIDSRVVDPTLSTLGRGTAPAVVFRFSKDDKSAAAQIGSNLAPLWRWGVTVSGPLSKSGGNTVLASNEGLSAGASGELVVRGLFLRTAPRLPFREFADLCARHRRPEVAVPKDGGCIRDDLTKLGKRALDARAFAPTWTLGGALKVGASKFAYTDPATFVDHTDPHSGWSAAIVGGRFQSGTLSALLYYVGGSIRHETAFLARSVSNVCTPIPQSTSTTCRDIAIGAPQRRSTTILQLEARSFIGDAAGLAPRIAYETVGRNWSIDVPVYLRNVDGPFNGGVDIAWNSQQREITVSLFVGALANVIP